MSAFAPRVFSVTPRAGSFGQDEGSNSEPPLTRVAYVNALIGDDIDGLIDNDAYPFLTIAGAFAALEAAYPSGSWKVWLQVDCAEGFTYPAASADDFKLMGESTSVLYSGVVEIPRTAAIDFTIDNLHVTGELRFDANSGGFNSGHIIRLANSAVVDLITADGADGAASAPGNQPDPATGSNGDDGSSGATPGSGEPGQSITNNGGTGSDGGTGAVAASGQILGSGTVALLNARGGDGVDGGAGGTGGDATGGNGGNGGNQTEAIGDGGNGGNGGNATSNGGLGGNGGNGGNGGVWTKASGVTITASDVTGGAAGNGGAAGSGGTATAGSGGSGGSAGGEGGTAGSPGAPGSTTSNTGTAGNNGSAGTNGSVS